MTKWPTPKTVVRSFLDFVGYYRRFIKDYSKISKPIREVITGLENQSKRTAKKTLIEWTEAANSAFETLKELHTSTPILAYPDYQLPFILHTDSSSEGLGAVLYQKQEGKLRVIAYASRSVSKTEANYPAHKLEFLALKWAVCEKSHEYLYGAKTFDIYVVRRRGRLAPRQPLSVCALLPAYEGNRHLRPLGNLGHRLRRLRWID